MQHVLNGLIDLQMAIITILQKRIKAVSEKFKEDPLRVYRVARFAADLQFKVEEKTILMMKEMKNEIATLSKERVFEELKKN